MYHDSAQITMPSHRAKESEAASSCSSQSFVHMPLDPRVDSIRLLQIISRDAGTVQTTTLSPRDRSAHVIKCTLAVFPFSKKPKYHALSYSWGEVTDKKPIEVNGTRFFVGANLWDALNNDNIGGNKTLMWIDAICINQGDVQERNHQVRVMPYIYSRAQVVHVWLGKFVPDVDSQDDRTTLPVSRVVSSCSAAYWTRVWIVQEIGRARSIFIHEGSLVTEWETYIAEIKRGTDADDDLVPVQLFNENSARYTTGHTLQNLLRNHEKALCTEPRDKIYGFIGLASDCAGDIPIDYKKTLWEVYEDTVRFKIRDTKSRQYDMLDFFRLVTRTMGGSEAVCPLRPLRDFCHDMTSYVEKHMPRKDNVVCLPARLVGRIEYLGPRYEDVITELRTVDDWRGSIPRVFEPYMLPRALELSDLFLEALDDFGEENVGYRRTVFTLVRKVRWKSTQPSWAVDTFERNYSYKPHSYPLRSSPDDQGTELGRPLMTKNASETNKTQRQADRARLFLLRIRADAGEPPLMGLAPGGAKEGDLVVQVQGLERAIVVRRRAHERDGFQEFKIVGCAGLAEGDLSVARQRRGKHLSDGKPPFFATGTFDDLHADDEIGVYMDIPTAWEISHPWEPTA